MTSSDPNKGCCGNVLLGKENEGADFIGKVHNPTGVFDPLEKEMR